MKLDFLKKKEKVAVGAPADGGVQPGQTNSNLGRRKRRKLSLKEKLIIIVPAVALLVAAALVYFLLSQKDSKDVGEPLVQYYVGMTSRISEDVKLINNGDEVFLSADGSVGPVNDLPLYYAERKAVLFANPVVYCDVRMNNYKQIPKFSTVGIDAVGNLKVSYEGKERTLQKGFLYDGKDIFILLEPMSVRFNGYLFELPEFSYIEAVYGDNVMIFNYDTKECFMEQAKGEIVAEVESGDYTLYLMNESVVLRDGSKKLLFTRPELLDPIV